MMREYARRQTALLLDRRDDRAVLEVASSHDIDLEQWGAERSGEAFLEVYNRPIEVVRERP